MLLNSVIHIPLSTIFQSEIKDTGLIGLNFSNVLQQQYQITFKQVSRFVPLLH